MFGVYNTWLTLCLVATLLLKTEMSAGELKLDNNYRKLDLFFVSFFICQTHTVILIPLDNLKFNFVLLRSCNDNQI
jgi:hypothetical protein